MKKFAFVLVLLACIAGNSYAAENYHYATTDMTWAEFYAGEIGEAPSALTVSYDAVTTASKRFVTRFQGFNAEETSGGGSTFSGVKDVQVRMTDDVYNALTDKSRYTESTTAFTEYKDVNADGSFRKMITASVDANAKLPALSVSLSGGKATTHGNYRLTISDFSFEDLGADTGTSNDKFLGVTLETDDGAVYGLKPLHNLWIGGTPSLAAQIGFSIEDFTEKNGTHLSYAHTADLPGKTIKKITYMLKNQPDPVISCDLYVREWTDAKVEVAGGYAAAGTDVPIGLVFSDVPDDAEYKYSVLKTGARADRGDVVEHTYSDGLLTIKGEIKSGDQYTLLLSDDKYIDISTTFTVKTARYATTTMSYAEFYAGETGSKDTELKEAGLDAVSTPTIRHTGTLKQVDAVSDDNGSTYSGMKNVHVRMTEDVYNALSDKTRYTFPSGKVFTEFKEVSSDGTFGKLAVSLEKKTAAGSMGYGGHQQYILTTSDTTLVNSGSGTNLLAGTITAGGKVYGMRHIENLWARASQIGFAVSAFTENSNKDEKDYKYTADLEGKTVTNVTYYFASGDQYYAWTFDSDVKVKHQTSAAVSLSEPEDGWLESMGDVSIPVTWNPAAPSDSNYAITVSSVQGRTATALDSSRYTYADGTLTIKGGIEAGSYRITFTDANYIDVTANFTLYSTRATSKIISPDVNNAGQVSFLITPKGASSVVDEFMDGSKYVNADGYTDPAGNSSEVYAPSGSLTDSGFSFDVALNGVDTDKIAVVGFGKQFYVTPATAGNLYQDFMAKVRALPVTEEPYRGAKGDGLKAIGLTVVSVRGNTSTDVTEFTGAGLRISDDNNIEVFYGVMLADASEADLGEDQGKRLTFSPEGETLVADGAKDGHLKAAWYMVLSAVAEDDGKTDDGKTDDGKTDDGQKTDDGKTDDGKTDDGQKTDDQNVPGGNTGSKGTVSQPSQAVVNLITGNTDKVITTINSKFNGRVPAGTPAEVLTVKAGNVSAIQEAPDDEEVVFAVQEMKITESKVYVFAIKLLDLAPLTPIHWHCAKKATDASVGASDADDEEVPAVFYDDEGNVTDVVPSSQNVNVAAYFEKDNTYTPYITASEIPEEGTGPDDSNGGCDTVNSLAPAMMLAVMLFVARKK